MSRGLGATQKRIIDLVREARGSFLTTRQLADALGKSMRQVQFSVHTLAERGLVELTLEPQLRVWPVGATEARRRYWASIEATYRDQQLRRPAHCGPGCIENHVGADKTHWA
jgi:DNA-binding IclR family transcriptional regulator